MSQQGSASGVGASGCGRGGRGGVWESQAQAEHMSHSLERKRKELNFFIYHDSLTNDI